MPHGSVSYGETWTVSAPRAGTTEATQAKPASMQCCTGHGPAETKWFHLQELLNVKPFQQPILIPKHSQKLTPQITCGSLLLKIT